MTIAVIEIAPFDANKGKLIYRHSFQLMIRNRNQDFIKAFGKHLKKLRLSKGLTQEELCYMSGLQLSHLGRIERGERTLTLPTLFTLAIALGEEPKKLLDFKFRVRKEP